MAGVVFLSFAAEEAETGYLGHMRTGHWSVERLTHLAIAESTDHLSSRGNNLDAARILLDYAEDVGGAVDVLCRGNEFSEAYRMVSISGTCKKST